MGATAKQQRFHPDVHLVFGFPKKSDGLQDENGHEMRTQNGHEMRAQNEHDIRAQNGHGFRALLSRPSTQTHASPKWARNTSPKWARITSPKWARNTSPKWVLKCVHFWPFLSTCQDPSWTPPACSKFVHKPCRLSRSKPEPPSRTPCFCLVGAVLPPELEAPGAKAMFCLINPSITIPLGSRSR